VTGRAPAARARRPSILTDRAIAFVVAILAFAGYWSTLGVPMSGDASSHVYLAYSFIREGDAEIGECLDQAPAGQCLVWAFGEHRYAPYLPGNALLLVPGAIAADALGVGPPDPAALGGLAKLQASVLVSLSVATVYLMLRRSVGRRPAVFLTFAYAFGTFAFAIASQLLWEHAATLLFVSLSLFLALGPPRTAHRAGATIGLAVLVRPQNALFGLGLLAYLWLRRRRSVPGFLAWGAPSAAFLFTFDLIALGSPFATTRVWLWGNDLLGGVVGPFVSPSRGLLIYGPFLAVALAALVAAWRDRVVPDAPGDRAVLLRVMGLVLVANVVLYALHEEWWGGWAYGNRYQSDLAPLYVLAIAHVWSRWLASAGARLAFAAAIGWAVLLQSIGASYQYFYWGSRHWDATPDIGRTPERLWSWTEAQWEWMLFRLVNDPGSRIAVQAAALLLIVIAFAALTRRADRLSA
jgi:uncharacterized protein YqgC (DUF456 family)